ESDDTSSKHPILLTPQPDSSPESRVPSPERQYSPVPSALTMYAPTRSLHELHPDTSLLPATRHLHCSMRTEIARAVGQPAARHRGNARDPRGARQGRKRAPSAHLLREGGDPELARPRRGDDAQILGTCERSMV